MRRRTRVLSWLIVAAVAVTAAGFGVSESVTGNDYQLQVVLPTAEGLRVGGRVQIQGNQVGTVQNLVPRNGQAVVTATLSGSDVPLHDGTTARISWDSLIGARYLDLLPGPAQNPELPSGHLIRAGDERVELDQVLASLDPATRTKLSSTIQQLQSTLGGHEKDLNAMLTATGPAFRELAAVLQAVGSDGPALRDVVTRLNQVVSTLANRKNSVSATVGNLDRLTGSVADRQQQLTDALRELPSTAGTANRTLDKVPAAVRATLPLLADLLPATQRLPQVADHLNPVLTALRPTAAELRPALAAAQTLLADTPALLDSAHAVVPAVTTTLHDISPAVAFLRPYTPDLVGWLSQWGSAMAGYDSQGHFVHTMVGLSGTAVNDNPGIVPPGLAQAPAPEPGWAGGQPWTDANGSGMR